jgi:hypothetical protein
VLYRPNATKAVPHIDTGSKDAGIAFTIDIPYPRFEEPVRVATYKRDPYSGHAATHFGICARLLVGARVLTFEVQDPKDGIHLQNLDDSRDCRPILGSITGDVKLHLYSQPRVVHPKSNHLEVFKKMVRLNQQPLEICLVEERGADIDPPWLPRPNGLSIIDTLHLHELPPLKQHEQEEKIPLEAMTIDPAECNQGGGC